MNIFNQIRFCCDLSVQYVMHLVNCRYVVAMRVSMNVSQILLLHMYACVYRCVCSKFRVSMCVFQITAAEYASIGVSSLRLQLSDCGSMVAARLGMKVMKANNIEAYKEETSRELVKLVDPV